MIEIAVYDTKPYDREYLAHAPGADCVPSRFHEFRLSAETAPAAKGAQVVCVFVNDQADRACMEILAALGVKLLALRCAGFNNVDLAAGFDLHGKTVGIVGTGKISRIAARIFRGFGCEVLA